MAEETKGPAETGSAAGSRQRRTERTQSRGSTRTAKPAPRGKRKALLVAINEYDVFNRLPSCIADADAFGEILEDYEGFEITRLYDGDADLASVRAALRTLFTDVTRDDRLVFFFSGHGTTFEVEGVSEECLVLHGKDEFLLDDEIVQAASDIPPGVLTLVIDSCFSGGLDKALLAPVRKGAKVVARGRVKAWTRPTAEAFQTHAERQKAATAVKRFGEETLKVSNPLDISIFGPVIGFAAYPESKGLIPAPSSDEVRQPEISGVLLAACLETETALASTAATGNLSMFTYALIDSLRRLGPTASVTSLVAATQEKVLSVGGQQTPLLKANPRFAAHSVFITNEPAAAIPGMGDGLDLTSTETLQRLLSGGTDMNPLLLTMLLGGLQKSGGAQQKFDPATVTAAVQAAVTIAGLFKGEQKFLPGFPTPGPINPLLLLAASGGQKGILDVIPIILPLLKGDQADASQKGLFDALPVILPLLLKSGGAGNQKGIVDILPYVLPMLKGGGGGEQKLDPATITAAAAVITALGGLFD